MSDPHAPFVEPSPAREPRTARPGKPSRLLVLGVLIFAFLAFHLLIGAAFASPARDRWQTALQTGFAAATVWSVFRSARPAAAVGFAVAATGAARGLAALVEAFLS